MEKFTDNSSLGKNSHPKKNKKKILYPSWKSIAIDSLKKAQKSNPDIFNESFHSYQKIFSKLDLVQTVIEKSDPVNLILFLSGADASYEPRLSFDTVFENFKRISVRPNEFYAVFDLYRFQHKEVDENIRKILGIEPSDFTLPAMAGWVPDNPLFHKRDNNHVLRWASIAYFMFTLNLFKWKSMEDQYRVRFRVGMSKSSIKEYREQEFLALEKLCFLFYDKTEDGSTRPIYHFDKWLAYHQSEFDAVRPMWISTPERQSHLNNFLYLINAYLLQIPPQYLVLLHERNYCDRNKSIALAVNEKIKKHTGIISDLDEHQVADCFGKTIRGKTSQTMNIWDKRSLDDQENIISDTHAVQAAKTLGLLPIPDQILEMIYKNVVEQ